jgi:hypothetical protein
VQQRQSAGKSERQDHQYAAVRVHGEGASPAAQSGFSMLIDFDPARPQKNP